jgi:hypothetical protein
MVRQKHVTCLLVLFLDSQLIVFFHSTTTARRNFKVNVLRALDQGLLTLDDEDDFLANFDMKEILKSTGKKYERTIIEQFHSLCASYADWKDDQNKPMEGVANDIIEEACGVRLIDDSSSGGFVSLPELVPEVEDKKTTQLMKKMVLLMEKQLSCSSEALDKLDILIEKLSRLTSDAESVVQEVCVNPFLDNVDDDEYSIVAKAGTAAKSGHFHSIVTVLLAVIVIMVSAYQYDEIADVLVAYKNKLLW